MEQHTVESARLFVFACVTEQMSKAEAYLHDRIWSPSIGRVGREDGRDDACGVLM